MRNPEPHVHPGDHLRTGSVLAVDLTGTDGYNTGLRVRAELTLAEAIELAENLNIHINEVVKARRSWR